MPTGRLTPPRSPILSQPLRDNGEAASPTACFQIDIADSGIGIPPDRLEHIFERFTQADSSTTRRFGGTGLGLAISKSLVELMGGTIGVTNNLGIGSRFSIQLPLAQEPAGELPLADLHGDPSGLVTQHRVAESHAAKGTAMSRPQWLETRVLVVDDNAVNQKVARMMLEQLGCRVDVAGNGEEAVQMVETLPYAVVFMDGEMPIMDGFAATRMISQSEAGQRHIPIIAMTAKAMLGDRERCLEVGIDDYISKPVKKEKLIEALNRWLPLPDTAPTAAPLAPMAIITSDRAVAVNEVVLDELRAMALATDPTFFEQIVQSYLSDTTQRLVDLRQAAESADASEIRKGAHAIKGASTSIGAERMGALSMQLEELGAAGTVTGAAEVVAQLAHEFGRVQVELETQLGVLPA